VEIYQSPVSNSDYFGQNLGSASSPAKPLGIITDLAAAPITSGLRRSQKLSQAQKSNRQQNRRLAKKRHRILVEKVLTKEFLGEYLKAHPSWRRIVDCGKYAAFVKSKGENKAHQANITVFWNEEHERAHVGGLAMCANVKYCPECAPKIQARRGAEIVQAVDFAYKGEPLYYENGEVAYYGKGKLVGMLTLTHPHKRDDAMSFLVKAHSLALSKLKKVRWWQKTKKDMGVVGTITAFEDTWGEANGLHRHTHTLIFAEDTSKLDVERLRQEWIKACKRAGFTIDAETHKNMEQHGVDWVPCCHASDYLQKLGAGYWGLERELTAGAAKKARSVGKRYTPFELLDAGKYKIFQEYMLATADTVQLRWSKGLKAWAGIGEKTDKEIADEMQEHSEPVAVVRPDEWLQIRRKDLECVMLEVLEDCGVDGLKAWALGNGFNFYFVDKQSLHIDDSPPDG